MAQRLGRASTALIVAVFLHGCAGTRARMPANASSGIHVEPFADYHADADCAELVKAIREATRTPGPLHDRYRDLQVVDSHNHGAAGDSLKAIELQGRYFVDRMVLFGNISEPRAVETDQAAFAVYARHPDRIYPFFAGIPLRDRAGVAMAKANLEQGYLGMGELVAASTHSPVTSRLPWKAQHPNDGILPELYRLSAEYRVPVLLHIDPPFGEPIQELEQALTENPNAVIVFGHANAYNTPENIEQLIRRHPNLYIDFYAGFTAHNPESTNKLVDFTPVIERYPGRFVISTDSGFGISPEHALEAMYELVDLLAPETACQVSHQTMERIIESQLPTRTQIERIEALSRELGEQGVQKLNKREANELILQLEKRRASPKSDVN